MLIFINYKNANFCQITLHIKIFIHKRKVVPFFCLAVYVPGERIVLTVQPRGRKCGQHVRSSMNFLDNTIDLPPSLGRSCKRGAESVVLSTKFIDDRAR